MTQETIPEDVREPAQVFRLGEYLAEEMIERGWNAADVAYRMGFKDETDFCVKAFLVDLILAIDDPKCIIKKEDYRDLERAFGVSEGFLERLDATWRKYPDRLSPYEAPDFLFSKAMEIKKR